MFHQFFKLPRSWSHRTPRSARRARGGKPLSLRRSPRLEQLEQRQLLAVEPVSAVFGAITADGPSFFDGAADHAASADGRFVVFTSNATDFVPPAQDANNATDVFLYDRADQSVRLISREDGATNVTSDGASFAPMISDDGSVITFLSTSTNLVPQQADANGVADLFRYNVALDEMTLVSHVTGSAATAGNGAVLSASMDSTGTNIALESLATDLASLPAPGDANAAADVFLWHDDGFTPGGIVSLLSKSAATGGTGDARSFAPIVNGTGQFVLFNSDATDIVAPQQDGNGGSDVFLYNVQTGVTTLVSGSAGSPSITGSAPSRAAGFDHFGKFALLTSEATDVGTIFDPLTGVLSPAPAGNAAVTNGGFETGNLAGWTAALPSGADSSLEVGNFTGTVPAHSGNNALWFGSVGAVDDTVSQTLATVPGQSYTVDFWLKSLPSDPFASDNHFGVSWDGSPIAALEQTNVGAFDWTEFKFTAVASSTSTTLLFGGRNVAAFFGLDDVKVLGGGTEAYLFDVETHAMTLVSHVAGSPFAGSGIDASTPQISADGRFVAFASAAPDVAPGVADAAGFDDVFLYDRLTGANQLVSHVPGQPTTPAGDDSSAPALSGDGRFVAFASRAANLVIAQVDFNLASDVFVWDRATDAMSLASQSAAVPATAGDAASTHPVISRNGAAVAFNSDAANIFPADINAASDVFLFAAAAQGANSAPVLGPVAAAVDPTAPLGTSVDDILATPGLYSDADGTLTKGLAITGQDETNGVWQFTTDGGIHWQPFGITGDLLAILLSADGAGENRVQFLPNVGFSGSAAVTFRGWDMTNGLTSGSINVDVSTNGLQTAYSAETATAVATLNSAPTVATAASADPSPATGTTTNLSVLGADVNTGESSLVYTWVATSIPAGAADPTFSANGTNAAKNTTATFSQAGDYTFEVTITDPGNLTATSSVAVTVNQTLTTIVVAPAPASLDAAGTQQFTTAASDQFGAALAVTPTFTWSTTVGAITPDGLLTAPQASAVGTVTAGSGGVSGTSSVTVTDHAPTVDTPAAAAPNAVLSKPVALSVLGADADTGEGILTYTWAVALKPSGAATATFSANGTNAAKNVSAAFSQVGTYGLTVTITDPGGLSVTSSVNVTVRRASTTTITSNLSPPTVFGQKVTLTAKVAAAAANTGTPTGTVTFMDGAAVLGTASLTRGSASLVVSTLPAGAHNITAVFNGNAAFAGSTSPGKSHTVNRARTTTTLVVPAKASTFGSPVTFSATVQAMAPGGGTPTGTVTFKDGAAVLDTVSLSGGKAALTTSSLSVGSHSITAVYNGSGNFLADASTSRSYRVNPAPAALSALASALASNQQKRTAASVFDQALASTANWLG